MTRINITSDEETLLEEYAAKKKVQFIPAMIFVGVFIIAGVVGNVFLFIYYGFKIKRTPSTLFISFLSVIDLVTCFLMSDHILGLWFIVTFKSKVACKTYVFVNFWFIYCSNFILTVICIDRYRKLCRPFKRQFTHVTAKVAITITVLLSLLFAVPAIFIMDIEHVNITNKDHETFRGYHCFYTTKENLRTLVTVFNMIGMMILIGLILFFIIVYSLIIRNLIRLKSKKKAQSVPTRTYTDETSQIETDKQEIPTDLIEIDKQDMSIDMTSEPKSESINTHATKGSLTTATATAPEVKLTIMTILMTIIFIISYIPYFIVILYVNLILKVPRYELNVGIQIVYRFIVINSAANPYIFLIFNKAFRSFVVDCCRKTTCCFKC